MEDIYNELLDQFSDTLEKTSEDINKANADKNMTSCQKKVVNFDKFKDNLIKDMALTDTPKSCDALYMTPQNEFYMIEFKNGKINKRENYRINRKILESLLMVSEKFSSTINFTRNNMYFILVYNEKVSHDDQNKATEQEQHENIGVRRVSKPVFNRAHTREILFGLERFKKLYFKDVFTYSKTEFEYEFVSKYCV